MSGSLLNNTNGITVYVCQQSATPTCPSSMPNATTARTAVDYYASTYPGIDLTVIDELRGDNITNGEDIFSQGINLHFIGRSSGQTPPNATTPFIIDYPIHVGSQESIEGEGDCTGAGIGCTEFTLASTFPNGIMKPAAFVPMTPSCSGLTTGTWIVGLTLVTVSGSTDSTLATVMIPTGTNECIEVFKPSGAGSGTSWAVFAQPPGGAALVWQTTLGGGTPNWTISPATFIPKGNAPPGINLSQVGITLGNANPTSTSIHPVSNDLTGLFSTSNRARNFTVNGNGAQTCIAVTAAQNQGILSDVNVSNCGSVTTTTGGVKTTTPGYTTAAIVYEGFGGAPAGPVAFPTRDITVVPSNCSASTPCTLFNDGGGMFGTTTQMLPNYCILVDGAVNPAPFTNVALPCAQPPMSGPAVDFPTTFAAFELMAPTSSSPKVDIHGLHVEAAGPGFAGLENDGYSLHLSGMDCSQGQSGSSGTCLQQNSGSVSSELIVAGGGVSQACEATQNHHFHTLPFIFESSAQQ